MKAKRLVVRSKSLASRLAGVSILGFGVSWKAPEPDRTVVRDIITELEDRRALYVGAIMEQTNEVVASILKIREILTGGIKRVSDDSPAAEAFRIMRAACRDFLTRPGAGNFMDAHWGNWQQEEFLVGLGKLRAIFGLQLALLGYLYGIDIEEGLAGILPPESLKAD